MSSDSNSENSQHLVESTEQTFSNESEGGSDVKSKSPQPRSEEQPLQTNQNEGDPQLNKGELNEEHRKQPTMKEDDENTQKNRESNHMKENSQNPIESTEQNFSNESEGGSDVKSKGPQSGSEEQPLQTNQNEGDPQLNKGELNEEHRKQPIVKEDEENTQENREIQQKAGEVSNNMKDCPGKDIDSVKSISDDIKNDAKQVVRKGEQDDKDKEQKNQEKDEKEEDKGEESKEMAGKSKCTQMDMVNPLEQD
ncbi:uncharacterized protein LOC143518167 [Brachyhypopomus gauderio]|uniref:uncharacterized protein LOC143518167 n=1 Tax=Brachyhypopomus gauderio TaxID=698409 RepID=UPI0040422625